MIRLKFRYSFECDQKWLEFLKKKQWAQIQGRWISWSKLSSILSFVKKKNHFRPMQFILFTNVYSCPGVFLPWVRFRLALIPSFIERIVNKIVWRFKSNNIPAADCHITWNDFNWIENCWFKRTFRSQRLCSPRNLYEIAYNYCVRNRLQ